MTDCAIISRSEAKAAGLKRYFTGEACHAGHVAERCVSDCKCVECSRLKSRDPDYRERRKEYKAAHQRAYRVKYPDLVAATEAKRDKAARAEARREARAKPDSNHKEVLRKSYQKHKAKRNAEMKAWRAVPANKEAMLAYMRCFKAARRANPLPGHFTTDDVLILFEKQDGQCAACGCDLVRYEIDHIDPLAKGGSNWPSNLQLLCAPCNRSKGKKTMQEWNDYLTAHSESRVCLHF
jgi:5-methylcytosine-specific restriction endonuclease McrA